MQFTILPVTGSPPLTLTPPAVFLVTDNWNDWFKFVTMFSVFYVDGTSRKRLGSVKIGQFGMKQGAPAVLPEGAQPDGQRRPTLPDSFEQLGPNCFSIGQDDDFYVQLDALGEDTRREILIGLRDMAYDLAIFEAARYEPVTQVALLRSVTASTIRGQFHRLAHGGARLSGYTFVYTPPTDGEATSVNFEVLPESKPPTNIHVLIGRNGVGKTHFLNNFARAIVDAEADAAKVGTVTFANVGAGNPATFANLISVTFSAFDQFEPFPEPSEAKSTIKYAYIGLRRRTDDPKELVAPKQPGQLTREFSDSVRECRVGGKRRRWHAALATLESDPIFKDAEISALADVGDEVELKAEASKKFKLLSSGHKIVLLTITRLVEVLEERSLVLLDEPEGHLHPPLLSAFVRALSDLMIDRNGVSIIATHSPVVLQEVPKKCVWKVRRVGARSVLERPEIETFGEGVGVLTREVFGLEVVESGFHRMLADRVAASNLTFDQVLAEYGGELGDEARALVRSLVAERNERRT